MSNYLGRCKEPGCGFALFATREDVREGEKFGDVKPGAAVRVGNNGVFGRCHGGHKFFPLKLVQGTYSAVHECDSRCLNAKGHSCTCSCGGANHGRGHASVIVSASEAPESEFIGEVDKFIVGTATVVRQGETFNEEDYPLRNRVPYTFRTDQGSVIVWWVPTFIDDPEFKQGQRVTFRAKVAEHKLYNDEKQTRVTHLTEVES